MQPPSPTFVSPSNLILGHHQQRKSLGFQACTRRLTVLSNMITQEKNRLKTADLIVTDDIQAHIAFLQPQVKELKKQRQDHIEAYSSLKTQQQLLTSIVGIGDNTAAVILAEIGSFSQFSSARQLAAFAGVTPQEYQSGTSVKHGFSW